MGVRRTSLLTAIRYVRGVDIKTNAIRSIRRDRKPDPARIAIARTNIRRQFSFTVRIRGTNSDTGDPIEQFITLTSDSTRSIEELELEARDTVESNRKNYPIDIEDISLVQALRRA